MACEMFIETYKVRSSDQGKLIADLHYRIDLFVEAPLLLVVLITGALLLDQATWSTWLAIKVAAALIVIGGNVACVAIVVQRYRALRGVEDEEALSAFATQTQRIHWIGVSFIPLGVAVFALGWAIS